MCESLIFFFFFFKKKTAYEIKECDWISDVCSADLDWKRAGAQPHQETRARIFSQAEGPDDSVERYRRHRQAGSRSAFPRGRRQRARAGVDPRRRAGLEARFWSKNLFFSCSASTAPSSLPCSRARAAFIRAARPMRKRRSGVSAFFADCASHLCACSTATREIRAGTIPSLNKHSWKNARS